MRLRHRVTVKSSLTNWGTRLWHASCPGCLWVSLPYLRHPGAVEWAHAHAMTCKRLHRREGL